MNHLKVLFVCPVIAMDYFNFFFKCQCMILVMDNFLHVENAPGKHLSFTTFISAPTFASVPS